MRPVVPAAYVRQSVDHLQGIADQIADCQALAGKLGWPRPTVYADNDQKASKGRPRPAYTRLMADIRAGRVDGLLFTQSTRIIRHPRELEDFIDLLETVTIPDLLETVTIPVESVRSGTYDLTTADGRFMARQYGILAKREVELLAERMRRRRQQEAVDGKPHGPVGYGWQRKDGKNVLHPVESAVVRDVVRRILSGESIASITRDLNEKGVKPPPRNTLWVRSTVRLIANRASNAGLRVHKGKVVGAFVHCEEIITEDEYIRLLAILKDPTRRTHKTNTHKHLLSGIARCGVCGRPLHTIPGSSRRAPTYACRESECYGVRRQMKHVDDLIVGLVCSRLSRPDATEVFVEADNRDLLAEQQTLRAKLDYAADQYADDLIDGNQLRRITERLRPRLEKVETQIAQSSTHVGLADLATPNIREHWDTIPLDRRRAVIKLLFEDVRILPRKPGQSTHAFDASRVAVKWKQVDAVRRSAHGLAEEPLRSEQRSTRRR